MSRTLSFVLLAAALAPACARDTGLRRARGMEQAQRDEPDHDELKRGTGISQVGLVRPGGPARPSRLQQGVEEDRLWSDADDWEPVVAADRGSSWVYQMTTRLTADDSVVVFRASSDGGASYGPDHLVYDSTRQQYDPQLAVSGDGTVYACWLEVPHWETFVAHSTDHGATWSAPVPVETSLNWTDHGWLAVSEDGRDVYVAFNKTDSWVASSHDGGASFLPPMRTNQTGRTFYDTGGAVAPDGTVWFGAAEYSNRYDGRIRVWVLRSIDRGASFASTLLDVSLAAPRCEWAPGCYWGFLGPCTGLAVDAAGTVLFAYNAGHAFTDPQQVWVRTTLDGVHWNPPQVVSLSDKRTNNAFPVVVAGAGPGEFAVVWQSDNNGDTTAWNTWMRRTSDAGRTWGPLARLSTSEGGAPYKTVKGYGFTYGDYMNASADGGGRVHAIWGAGPDYNGPGGTWYTRSL